MYQNVRRLGYVGLLALLATVGFAQDYSSQSQQKSQMTEASKSISTPTASAVNLQYGTQLIGCDVKDSQGEKAGTIKDIVLNSSHDQIDYMVLEFGGLAGIGSKNLAIPISEFKAQYAETKPASASSDMRPNQPDETKSASGYDSSGRFSTTAAPANTSKLQCLVLNTPKDALQELKGVGREANWPDRLGSDWHSEQMTESQQTDNRSETDKTAFQARRVSKLLGTEVTLAGTSQTREPSERMSMQSSTTEGGAPSSDQKSQEQPDMRVAHEQKADTTSSKEPATGTKIGKLKDVAINTDNGRVAYGFVALQNTEGHNGELSPVPWSALQIQSGNKIQATLQATSVQTPATFAFKSDQQTQQLAQLADRDYSRRIYVAYDQGPQWEALGFVSPDNKGETTTPGDRQK